MTGASGVNVGPREADLKDYLLGVLPDAQRERIEERFLADEELHQEIAATADDLIHAYLVDALSADDRERFESYFLASPRRRERVAFMRTLVSAVDRVGATADARAPNRLAKVAPFLPWAAVLVVGLAAGTWSIGERRRGADTLADARQREEALGRRVASQDGRIQELERRLDADPEPADIATWPLRPGLERGAGDGQSLRPGSNWVRLRLPLDPDPRARAYQASLQTPEGREVLRVGGLQSRSDPHGKSVDVMVPAGLLRPGTYVLSLRRDTSGAPEEVAVSTFVVR